MQVDLYNGCKTVFVVVVVVADVVIVVVVVVVTQFILLSCQVEFL